MPPPEHEDRAHSEIAHAPVETHAKPGRGTRAANAAAAQRVIDQEGLMTPMLREAARKIDACLDEGSAEPAVGEMATTYDWGSHWDPHVITPSRVARLVPLLASQFHTFSIGLYSLGMLVGYAGGIAAIRSVVADALTNIPFPFLTHMLRDWDRQIWSAVAKDPKAANAMRHLFDRYHAQLVHEPELLGLAADTGAMPRTLAAAWYRAFWMPNGRLDLVVRDTKRLNDARQAHLISEEELHRIGTEMYGLHIGEPRTIQERVVDWMKTKAADVGIGEAPGYVPNQLGGGATIVATMIPKGHLGILQHTNFSVGVSKELNADGYYDETSHTIAVKKDLELDTALHELGHALDARMGHPSGRHELFGWRELHDANAFAAAVDLTGLDGHAAAALLAAYKQLFAGGRDWDAIIATEFKRHGVRQTPDLLYHPAYLAGAAVKTTADNFTDTDALDAPPYKNHVVFFNGYYGKGFALAKAFSDAYAATEDPSDRMRFAPYECFAQIYSRWYGSKDRSWTSHLPQPARSFFQHQVESFKGLGQS